MDISTVSIIVGIMSTATIAAAFVINKIINRTKHENNQDTKIESLIDHKESCIIERREQMNNLLNRVDKLENKSHDQDLIIISVNEKIESLYQAHETTQKMILTLQDNQQTTFKQLIDIISTIKKG